MALIGIETLREYVETILLTGRVDGCRPVSTFLIAAPEQGKTSIAIDRQCKSCIALTDVTGMGIQNLCKMQPEISHFILNDLTAAASHRANVSKFTIQMLNAMTEEGIMAVSYPGHMESFEHGIRGVIACLTVEQARDHRAWWHRSGFASRILPFCYSYPEKLVLSIKAAIDHDSSFLSKKSDEFKVPDKPLHVAISENQTLAVRQLSDSLARRVEEIGLRKLKQYRALVKAHAIRRTWKKPEVKTEDIQFLQRIDGYISWKDPRPLI